MTYGRLIEYEGRMGEVFRRQVVYPAAAQRASQAHEAREARLLSRWVIDRSSGRPALRLAWRTADAAPAAPSARVA
jgi:hypothetical protein